jgi:membrane fusion protein (multidrug efflux system)
LNTAQQQVAVLQTAEAEARSQLRRAQAVEQQARLNLGYATITAPADGTVGARSLRVGQYVQAGTQLMAIVPLRSVYVVANYKETQLTNVRPGQPVDIAVDTFPGHAVHGVVDSIAPASGQQFALLPPDNATGNFTKIVQRIPVKIVLRDDTALAGMLRPGMSVEPTIDTRPAAARAQGA